MTAAELRPEPRSRRPFYTSLTFERWIGVVLIVLSMASMIVVSVQVTRMNDVTSCQAQYNDAYTEALVGRSEAARQERDAQRQMLLTVLAPAVTAEHATKAIETYLQALDAADLVRDEAQLPTQEC